MKRKTYRVQALVEIAVDAPHRDTAWALAKCRLSEIENVLDVRVTKNDVRLA